MGRIYLQADFACPPDEAFDLCRNVEAHLRSAAETAEQVVGGKTQGLLELDEEVEWEARHLGRRWRLRSRMVELERPLRFVDVQVRGPFAWFRHEHRFEALASGTRVHSTFAYRAPLGPLGRLLEWLLLDRHMRRFLHRRLTVLQQLCTAPR